MGPEDVEDRQLTGGDLGPERRVSVHALSEGLGQGLGLLDRAVRDEGADQDQQAPGVPGVDLGGLGEDRLALPVEPQVEVEAGEVMPGPLPRVGGGP